MFKSFSKERERKNAQFILMKSDNIGLEGRGVVKKEDCLQLNEKNIDILLFIIVEGSSSPTHTRTHAHTDTCKH